MQNQKHILLLGSGLMSESVLDYLLRRKENIVTLASNILEDAQKIASKKERTTACLVDVGNPNDLRKLIGPAHIVCSFVPYQFHGQIALICLELGKNMVTASYISPDLAILNEQAQQKGLTFLNEIGLDPGIDHLATMKTVDQVEEEGGKILSYESWCGGLPSPEFCDNPLGYKFSWSPIGAFGALSNDAQYLQDEQIIKIEGSQLQYQAQSLDINMSLNLEGYPNRDSVKYKDLYKLKDCKTVLRGTLRFGGFSVIINCLKEIGFFSKDLPTAKNWIEALEIKAKNQNLKEFEKVYSTRYQKLIEGDQNKDILEKYLSFYFLNEHKYKHLNENQKVVYPQTVLKAIRFFGFLDKSNEINEKASYLQNLVTLMEKKLTLKSGENDLPKNSDKLITRKSTLIQIGTNDRSAMAKTVGTPAGVAAQLILDGVIKDTGVLMPNKKSIYEPILEKLEEVGIRCIESEE